MAHGTRVRIAIFSTNGRYMMTAFWLNRINIWNLDGELITSTRYDNPLPTVKISTDNTMIITAS
jgi:hypothetical protein